jgi:CubicO group peptidase (beta-lactamase class C family)
MFPRSGRALLGLVIGSVAVPVLGLASPAFAAPAGCGTATPAALAAFFDGSVPDRLVRDRVPGVVVSVVTGDKTVFAKGYGSADLDAQVAFDPARSLVRIASITKLFTWTAVMQQVEAGRLDLNADVNQYLKAFKIPATYPEPVTLLTLLNHTSGFEDFIIGTGARSSADVEPLEKYLAHHMPARIRPPGEISAYSNYGAALAGYIVSQVSGEPYDQYIQRHVLEPLGMTHSTATEPVPAALAADLAASYNSDSVPPRRVPFTFDPLAPDGSISTTASDLTHFMIAQLNQGRFGDHSILTPATTALMHERSYAADPRLGGYAHGLMDRTFNGHRVLMHDGGWEGFESVLVLVPGCDLGLFVSTNATGGVDTLTDLMPKFFDRFTPTVPQAAASGASTAEPRAGFYEPARHSESAVDKLTTLLGPLRLTVSRDGTVHFKGKDWLPQGDGLYRKADGSDHLVFRTGTQGRRYVATDVTAYQLMSRGETLPVNLVILLVIAVLGLSALAVPVAAGWRRSFRRPVTTTATWRASRALAAGAAVLGLAFLVLLAAVLFGDTSAFLYGPPLGFRILLGLPVLMLVISGAALVGTVRGWRGSGAGIVARVHQVALFAGLATFAWFVWQWNLIGWQFI